MPKHAGLTEVPGDHTLRLTCLDIENVMRIVAVHLELDKDGNLFIEGENEQGKTSAIESFGMAMGGAGSVPDDPIHGDELEGKIVVTFGEDLTVTRVFRRGKPTQLKITSPNRRYKSLQSILDGLMTRLPNPLKFMEDSEEKKAKAISGLMGFDSSQLEAKAGAIYDARTDANTTVKRLAGALGSLPHDPKVPTEEVSVSRLVADLEAARLYNANGDAIDEELTSTTASIRALTERLATLHEQVAQTEKQIALEQDVRTKAVEALAIFEPADEDGIKEQIANAETFNDAVRANARRAELKTEHDAAIASAAELDAKYKAMLAKIDTERSAATSKLPVDGLSLDGGAVLYNRKPLSQAGKSAELDVSIAMAIATSPDKRIKVMCIDDAEKLDKTRTRRVLTRAREAGFQVIMARTRGDGEPAVTIEDGHVKE